MNRRLVRLLLALYPPAWRVRYGAEVVRLTEELIAAGEITPAEGALNLAVNAAAERGRALADSRRTAAAMALAALVAVAGSFYAAGHGRPADPGPPASAAPAPARLARVLCSFPHPAAASVAFARIASAGAGAAPSVTRLIPVGGAFTLDFPAGTNLAASPRILVPVPFAWPGKGDRRLCVELPARCKTGPGRTVAIAPGDHVVQVMVVPRDCAPVSLTGTALTRTGAGKGRR